MEQLLRGSLIERYLRCGKPGCKCAQGEGHGPKYYLSVSFAGHRPQMDYVRQGDYEHVSQYLVRWLGATMRLGLIARAFFTYEPCRKCDSVCDGCDNHKPCPLR